MSMPDGSDHETSTKFSTNCPLPMYTGSRSAMPQPFGPQPHAEQNPSVAGGPGSLGFGMLLPCASPDFDVVVLSKPSLALCETRSAIEHPSSVSSSSAHCDGSGLSIWPVVSCGCWPAARLRSIAWRRNRWTWKMETDADMGPAPETARSGVITTRPVDGCTSVATRSTVWPATLVPQAVRPTSTASGPV
jgi:hypothetical protein